MVRTYLGLTGDDRPVHGDPRALYFGAEVEALSLVPLGDARLGPTRLADRVGDQLAA